MAIRFRWPGSQNPKLSIDIASTIGIEPEDTMTIEVNGESVGTLRGNGLGVFANVGTGETIDTNFRTVTFDLPDGITEIESLRIAIGPFAGAGEAVGIDRIRITDGEPTDAKVVPERAGRLIQQGNNGYAGTEDAEIRSNEPESVRGSGLLVASSANSQDTRQSLIRFNDLIGDGEQQVSPDMEIEKATLNVHVIGPGSQLALHRMLVAWDDDTATWDGFGDGVQIDDTEAVANSEDLQIANAGVTTWDVTDSVRAWQSDPDSNLGWLVRSTGADGADFLASEAINRDFGGLNLAPFLEIVLDDCPLGPLGDLNCDGAIEVSDFLILSRNFNQNVAPNADGDLTGDGLVNVRDFLTLSQNFGARAEAATVPVPEPTNYVLFAMIGLSVVRRRSEARVTRG